MARRSLFSLSRLPAKRRGFAARTTRWGESTLEVARWARSRKASGRWALGGAVLGLLLGVVLFAPAAWLSNAVASASGQHLLLADARGTVWSGSAVVVLAGGPGSRDARSLPGRMEWSLRPVLIGGPGLLLLAKQACCLNGEVGLRLQPGLGRLRATLLSPPAWTGQWPNAWLGGFGTPLNTLQLGGALRLSSPGLMLDWVQ